jgi:plastocyanin
MSQLRIVVVSAVLMFATACGGGSPSPTTPSPMPSPAPAPAPPPVVSSSEVTIPRGAETLGDQAFRPDDLTVAVGSTVTWTNTDSVSHTSTSDAVGWNSGIVPPSGQFSFTFQTAGTFPYHCAIHPGMVGRVVAR